MRREFKLHDIRRSKVWREARDEGREEGRALGALEERKRMVTVWLADRMSHSQVAKLLKIPVKEVEKLANGQPA